MTTTLLGDGQYLVIREEDEFRVGIDEPAKHRPIGDPVGRRPFSGHPLHRSPSAVGFAGRDVPDTALSPVPSERCAHRHRATS